jgi:hypothetical protein
MKEFNYWIYCKLRMTPAFLMTFDLINKSVIGNEAKNPVTMSELGFVGLKD